MKIHTQISLQNIYPLYLMSIGERIEIFWIFVVEIYDMQCSNRISNCYSANVMVDGKIFYIWLPIIISIRKAYQHWTLGNDRGV
jgi:hypothetical protein